MFVQRDLRKIDEILLDTSADKRLLKFSNRKAEFGGNLRVLCSESKVMLLTALETLNIYSNELTNLQGIGLLSYTPLRELNLGCNKISSLPLEFGSLHGLCSLWLDDNRLDAIPLCIFQLHNLVTLRLSGNSIREVPQGINSLQQLENLAIDNNALSTFPEGMDLPNLKQLWLRQNKIRSFPSAFNGLPDLEVLSMSSNHLTEIPDEITSLSKLKKLYANGNRIVTVSEMMTTLASLEVLNLANNLINEIPKAWRERWGDVQTESGLMQASSSQGSNPLVVTLVGNPLTVHAFKISSTS